MNRDDVVNKKCPLCGKGCGVIIECDGCGVRDDEEEVRIDIESGLASCYGCREALGLT